MDRRCRLQRFARLASWFGAILNAASAKKSPTAGMLNRMQCSHSRSWWANPSAVNSRQTTCSAPVSCARVRQSDRTESAPSGGGVPIPTNVDSGLCLGPASAHLPFRAARRLIHPVRHEKLSPSREAGSETRHTKSVRFRGTHKRSRPTWQRANNFGEVSTFGRVQSPLVPFTSP